MNDINQISNLNQPIGQPNPMPTPSTPSKLPLILITILFLISIAAAIYFYLQTKLPRQEAAQVTASPARVASADPTEGWQTYYNTKYSFSLKYPPNWKPLGIQTDSDKFSFSIEGTNTPKSGPGDSVTIAFSVNNLDSELFDLAKEEYTSMRENEGGEVNLQDVKERKLSEAISGYSHSCNFLIPQECIYLSLSDKSKYLHILIANSDTENRGYQKIINQILSTFKFTKPIYTLEEVSKACIDIRNTGKYWNSKYNECISPDGEDITLKEYCYTYGGKYVEKGDSCRHVREEGLPCGPEIVNYCSFDMR